MSKPTTSAWEAVDKLEAISEQPNSATDIDSASKYCEEHGKFYGVGQKCSDCSKQPTKPSRATEENLTPVIEPKTKVENSEVAGQPLEQPTDPEYIKLMTDKPEQPNTELLIVKTIQGLTTCINNELVKLPTADTTLNIKRIALRAKALEKIDSFEQTMLELQKVFE